MKLLSWNIQWGRGLDGRVDLARTLRTLHEAGDFDAICLQEVAVDFPGLPGFHDAWDVLHPGAPHAPTVGIHPADFVDRPECFDFIFVTAGLAGHLKAYGIDSATAASDHQPVWVEWTRARAAAKLTSMSGLGTMALNKVE